MSIASWIQCDTELIIVNSLVILGGGWLGWNWVEKIRPQPHSSEV